MGYPRHFQRSKGEEDMPSTSPKRERNRTAALTLRLPAEDMRRLAVVAEASRQSPASFVQTMIRQQLADIELAFAPLTVISAPELEGVEPGELIRSEGESDERYAMRAAFVAELLAIPED
jgi:hypothetical protein